MYYDIKYNEKLVEVITWCKLYVRDKLHATVDVTNILSSCMTFSFYVCYLEKWNGTSKFEMPITFFFQM